MGYNGCTSDRYNGIGNRYVKLDSLFGTMPICQFEDYVELADYLLKYKDRVLAYDPSFKPLMDITLLTAVLRELYTGKESAILVGAELEVGILWGLLMTIFVKSQEEEEEE